MPETSFATETGQPGQQQHQLQHQLQLQLQHQLHSPKSVRRLASAHNLGTANKVSIANPPSLISQQRLQQQQLRHQQRAISPARRNASSQFDRSPRRGRANSDAPILHQLNAAMASSALRASRGQGGQWNVEELIRKGPPDGDPVQAMEALRLGVLRGEIKSDHDGMSAMRIYVWLIMLDAPILGTNEYLELVHRGASSAYSKIRNDTFRTMTTDPLFKRRVSEASLIRLLNAIAWKLQESRPPNSRVSLPSQDIPNTRHNSNLQGSPSPAAKNRARALTLTTEGGSDNNMAPEAGTYVQGMNVLAAPFLYAARSESEAFVAFHQLLTKECPGYIRGAMDGVHKGLALVDKVLRIVDPPLFHYLNSKALTAELYAFPSVLTLCACTPPLPEVLRLWDFLFAYGPHLNIVCIAAQLIIHKEKIMAHPSPSMFLRTFPALNAVEVQGATMLLLAKLPNDVYAEIVSHAQ